MALLDRAAQRLLDRLRLRVAPRSTSSDQGAHKSPVKGSGLEFAEHREYAPGDDARKIDWKAFARSRELTIRTYEEERDTRVFVLVDVSGSMTRGQPPKLELARRVAASFGFLATKQSDRVQVTAFASDLLRSTAVYRRRDDYPVLERFLEGLEAQGVGSFSDVSRAFVQKAPGRGYVVVVSDLLDANDLGPGLRAMAQRGHQLCVVRARCDEDYNPDFRGELELHDAESGDTVRVTATRELLEAYRAAVSEHIERARDAVRRVGGRMVDAPVEVEFDEVLRTVLAPMVDRR